MAERRIVNLEAVELKDAGDGQAFMASVARLGPLVGSTGLGCTLTVLPPGKKAWPFHRHHVIHELFYVLEGTGELRLEGERFPLRAGDLVASPAGKEAHQIVNTSDADLKYLAVSTLGEVDVVDYPDSGKVAYAAGIRNADFSTATTKALGRMTPANYFEGEK
jgi:uncharacterized cupin superfamily protein